jgi:hypothetical protein
VPRAPRRVGAELPVASRAPARSPAQVPRVMAAARRRLAAALLAASRALARSPAQVPRVMAAARPAAALLAASQARTHSPEPALRAMAAPAHSRAPEHRQVRLRQATAVLARARYLLARPAALVPPAG